MHILIISHVCYSIAQFYFTCTLSKVWSLFCPFLAIFREKIDTCSWSRIEIEKGKSNKSNIFFLDLSSHFPHKIKYIDKKENKSLEVTSSGNIWHFYIHFQVLTQFFLITITVFNKNANLKKKEKEKSHLDIGQPLIIKYVLVRALI